MVQRRVKGPAVIHRCRTAVEHNRFAPIFPASDEIGHGDLARGGDLNDIGVVGVADGDMGRRLTVERPKWAGRGLLSGWRHARSLGNIRRSSTAALSKQNLHAKSFLKKGTL